MLNMNKFIYENTKILEDSLNISHYKIAHKINVELIKIEPKTTAIRKVFVYRYIQKLKLKLNNYWIRLKVNVFKYKDVSPYPK